MKQPQSLIDLSNIILASTSPRRRALLQNYGIEFLSLAPDVVEEPIPGESARDYVVRNGKLKAQSVCLQYQEQCFGKLVLASDTVVVAPNGRILEKPKSIDDAKAMMNELNGQTHEVISSIVIAYSDGRPTGSIEADSESRQSHHFVCTEAISTQVTFGDLPEAWIEKYVATEEPYDKAGGYGIQEAAGAFVRRIDGSYSNVVGLPLYETFAILSDLDAVRHFYGKCSDLNSSVNVSNLVAVSKKKHISAIRLAHHFGQRAFGESYAQELESKRSQLHDCKGIAWHFIGKLQSNKLAQIARHADVVHSLEDIEKLDRLASECQKIGRKLHVYIKTQVSPLTPAASGCSWEQVQAIAERIQNTHASVVQLCGFMGMAPLGVGEKETESLFKDFMTQGIALWKQLGVTDRPLSFSLGMSADSHIALSVARQLGLQPPVLRLGSAVFGDRGT
jgi:septum formation protein